MIRSALRILVCSATLVACADSPCEVGDNCSCSFDSDCPDPLVEFCDRRVFACELRDEPLQPDVTADAGEDVTDDVAADAQLVEICDNGVDDDDDGLVDCDDPVCEITCDPPSLLVAYTESAGLPQVSLLSLAGDAARVVAGGGTEQLATDPAFASDGRLVVVFADQSFEGLRVLSLDGDVLRSIPNADGVTLVRQPSWTADGTLLAAGTLDGERVILEIPPDASVGAVRYRETNADRYVAAPTQLSDGSIVVATGETAGGLGGGTGDLAYLIDESLEQATTGLALSGRIVADQDGGLYSFSASAGRTIYMRPVRGQQLTLEDVEPVGDPLDAGCAPIDFNTLVCARAFELPTGVSVPDLVVVERSGRLLRRLTETPSISEGGAVVSPPLAAADPAP